MTLDKGDEQSKRIITRVGEKVGMEDIEWWEENRSICIALSSIHNSQAIQATVTICKERTSYCLKLSRVQIDNQVRRLPYHSLSVPQSIERYKIGKLETIQLDHSPFPCILSIAAPPFTEIVEFNRKPLFEMNLVQRNQTHSLVPEVSLLFENDKTTTNNIHYSVNWQKKATMQFH